MPVLTGLDVLAREDFAPLRGKSIGLLCNQASIAGNLRHVVDLILPLHVEGALEIKGLFGPEHGLYGHAQDQDEVEGAPSRRWLVRGEGARGGDIAVHSLYGEHREPTKKMLDGVDLYMIDIPDVGARYYTFLNQGVLSWPETAMAPNARQLRKTMVMDNQADLRIEPCADIPTMRGREKPDDEKRPVAAGWFVPASQNTEASMKRQRGFRLCDEVNPYP